MSESGPAPTMAERVGDRWTRMKLYILLTVNRELFTALLGGVYQDTGTGRDTQRDGYQELMERVRAGEVARVIVLEVSRLSRSMRDLATIVETIVDESDTGLHVLDMNLALEPDEDDPYQRAFLNIIGTIAQLEADMVLEREELYREFGPNGSSAATESLAGD